ncbi:MAG TPA: hypothetical protein VFB06_29645 [Streptosporangiaceae bacterium]|nr:hypothetical protein [Streptosporangiaceae bacterium]
MAVRGLWRVAKFGPAAATTTPEPRIASEAKAGSKMSAVRRTSAWPGGAVRGASR